MNKEEAEETLLEHVENVKKFSYEKLSKLMGAANNLSHEVDGKAGGQYDLEVESVWVGDPNGDIKVNIALFERSWDSFVPLSYVFIMSPEGEISE